MAALSSLVVVDLSSNDFVEAFPTLDRFITLGDPVALFVSGNHWICPYPVFGAHVVVSRDGCFQDWKELMQIGFPVVGISIVVVLIAYLIWSQSCSTRSCLTKVSGMIWFFTWIYAQVQIGLDVKFFVEMIHYVTTPLTN